MRRLLSFAILMCLGAGALAAQGLGEAAAREKKRREEEQKKRKGPARVITTEDLANVQAGTATEAKPELAQERGRKQSSDATSAEEPDPVGRARVKPVGPEGEVREFGGVDEKGWRNQALELRQEVQAGEQKLKGLEAQVSELFAQIQRSTDTYEILRLRTEQDKLREQLKLAQQELASTKEELSQLEDSARRAGVPPGWIR